MNRQGLIDSLIPQSVRKASVYTVPDSTGFIKLDAMENPYELPHMLREKLANRLAQVSLNRYPNPRAQALRPAVYSYMNIPDDLDIIFGNGSDEIIALIISLFISSNKVVCAPDPSFAMFEVLARQFRVPFRGLPLDHAFDIDLNEWSAILGKKASGLVFVPQPNNPTGNLFSIDLLEHIIKKSSALFVIDEAYTAFTDADYLSWAKRFPNVLIMRTLSKIGLAGGRFGMLIGAPEWIREFDKVRLPYNVNALTQEAVRFFLEHAEILSQQSTDIRNERSRMITLLRNIDINVWPSEANFVVIKVASGKVEAIFNGLKKRGILVKCLDGSHPRLEDTLRLTVGKSSDTDLLVSALSELVYS